MNRRHVLGCCAALGAGLFTTLATSSSVHGFSLREGLRNPCRGSLPSELAHHDIVLQAFDGIDIGKMWDTHAHLLGTGDSGSGCSINARMHEWWHPAQVLRRNAILNGACVPADTPSVDRAYVQRLRGLTDAFPAGARWLLFAFDHAHDDGGQLREDWTTFHVPNTYAAEVAREHADRFGWVASVHPYRHDALQCLDEAIARDIDRPSAPWRSAFDLWARLMDETAWQRTLHADVSAVFQANRTPRVRCTIVQRDDWHARLLHGSDHPLPGVMPLFAPDALAAEGLLDVKDVEPLRLIRQHNPLLFDFVLKRRVRSGSARLPRGVFETHQSFDRLTATT